MSERTSGAVEIVRSCLTEEWQSVDDVAGKCSCCSLSRSHVRNLLYYLWRQGKAVRRYDPHYAHRTFQYRLAEVSE